MDRLLATKSEGVWLIVRAVSFQDFQPMWSQITDVTDRQTDRQTVRRHAIPRPRICTKVHCAVKTMYSKTSMGLVYTTFASQCSYICTVSLIQTLQCQLQNLLATDLNAARQFAALILRARWMHKAAKLWPCRKIILLMLAMHKHQLFCFNYTPASL